MILRTKCVTKPTLLATAFAIVPAGFRLLPPKPGHFNVLVSIIDAKIALFEAGIVQMDIKPQNVMI